MTGTEIIRAQQDDGSNHSTFVVPLKTGASVSAGQDVIICLNAPAAAGAVTSWSATDTKSNTWTQRSLVIGSNANAQVGVLTSRLTTGLSQAAADTITITCGSRSPAIWGVLGFKFDDLVSSAYDSTASGTANNGGAAGTATGLTGGTAAQNLELVFACVGFAAATATHSFTGTWTATPAVLATNVSTPKMIQAAWKYVNASGTRSWAGTLSQSIVHADVLTAMKQATPGVQATHMKNQVTGLWVPTIRKRLVGGVWT